MTKTKLNYLKANLLMQAEIERKANFEKMLKDNTDRYLKSWSTDDKWKKYQQGQITREKAVKLAYDRQIKRFNKGISEKLEKINKAEKTTIPDYINVSIIWKKNTYWGYNPKVEVQTRIVGKAYQTYTGKASGCGYDKESAAVAEAFDQSESILLILYKAMDQAIKKGFSNGFYGSAEKALGYGSGYGVLPYFEGGVGSGCFWRILQNSGYTVKIHEFDKSSYWDIYKEV